MWLNKGILEQESGFRIQASGFRGHVPPKELFLYICKKYFFKFTPLEHGTNRSTI
jgi:hypothetical protein